MCYFNFKICCTNDYYCSVEGLKPGLQAERSEFRFHVGKRDSSLLENYQTGSEIYPASHSSTEVLVRKNIGRGFKLTTNLHLVPGLRMNGAVPLFTMYVCVAWRGTVIL